MQRPASLTVFGILNLAFAALGVFGTLFSLLMFAMPPAPEMPNPVLDLARQDTVYATFLVAATVLGFVACILLALAGVGLLRAKSSGRYLSIAYGLYAVVMGIVGIVVNYLFLFQPMLQKVAGGAAGPEQAVLIGGAVGGTLGGCIGLIYPVVLLFFMFRPSVVAACRPQPGADPWRS